MAGTPLAPRRGKDKGGGGVQPLLGTQSAETWGRSRTSYTDVNGMFGFEKA